MKRTCAATCAKPSRRAPAQRPARQRIRSSSITSSRTRIEVDVDCISDGETVVIGAIMEHIEEAGIHSGDSVVRDPAIFAEAGRAGGDRAKPRKRWRAS